MNSETKSMSAAKVDVLAKLRDLRERFKRCAIHCGSDEEFAEGACQQFDDAITAMAELIEAVTENRAATQAFANDGHPENCNRWRISEDRVMAALAKVQP